MVAVRMGSLSRNRGGVRPVAAFARPAALSRGRGCRGESEGRFNTIREGGRRQPSSAEVAVSDMQISHFWVGHLPESIRDRYFEEILDEGDDAPLSMFAQDQGQKYYDHDFLEYGWRAAGTVQELVAGYSYSDQWADELARRVADAGLKGFDFFLFISQEEVKQPRSVQGDGYWLHYLGIIEYRI